MKKIGMIGGVGPESTVDYYRMFVSTYRDRVRDGSYPLILINSIDLTSMVRLLNAGDLAGVADALSAEIQALANAGAEIGLLSSNTPHIVFNELARNSSIPLISIVEATADVAVARGFRKLGLLGSRYTMQGTFFQEVFTRRGMEILVPNLEEQNWIHEHYMGELVKGIFLPATRDQFLAIVGKLRERHGIEALILGGTELPLLLRDATSQIPFLDTARIHVDAVIKRALE
jgi:aspartate racemase